MEAGIIILAAGNSSRLGQPKQLLPFNGISLLRYVIKEALKAKLSPCFVVVGAYKDLISKELKNLNVVIVENKNWETGMASGIKAGLSILLTQNNNIENIIFAVCDQPFINQQVFENLLEERQNTGKEIVASLYQNILGTPVLFSKKYFKDLQQLTGDEGAKKILKKHAEDLTSIPFIKGEIDIDTMADYVKLQHQKEEEI